MCITFGQNEGTKKRIVIDVGHRGIDSGAIGINNIQEKDVVLNIAKTMLRLNKSVLNSNLNLYLTRYTDTLISLSDRSRLAKALDADVFVSLHCNASNRKSRGMEVYVHRSNYVNTKASIALSLSVLNEGTQKLGFKERGVKLANFQVLRETIAFCPAVLVEVGFVTHVDEARYFYKLENIRAIALAVLLGIDNYLNNEL
ncbi:N-acetylmuramoyl-L-alanine amidase family protein [Wocania ichthyoenteri]|uniref:N-acetylmuramoyl-L-alanine amidase family protein n=1 Tax=Wocania ichthyoenteri TaxID=1230531 RepID=UPI0009DE7576|nr:N-acetylmuramoyl-L-alanine amidase [Wocania ichthyoenteri]